MSHVASTWWVPSIPDSRLGDCESLEPVRRSTRSVGHTQYLCGLTLLSPSSGVYLRDDDVGLVARVTGSPSDPRTVSPDQIRALMRAGIPRCRTGPPSQNPADLPLREHQKQRSSDAFCVASDSSLRLCEASIRDVHHVAKLVVGKKLAPYADGGALELHWLQCRDFQTSAQRRKCSGGVVVVGGTLLRVLTRCRGLTFDLRLPTDRPAARGREGGTRDVAPQKLVVRRCSCVVARVVLSHYITHVAAPTESVLFSSLDRGEANRRERGTKLKYSVQFVRKKSTDLVEAGSRAEQRAPSVVDSVARSRSSRATMARSGGMIEQTFVVTIFVFIMGALAPLVNAQAPAPGPVPTSDGYAIDQSVAYTLLFLALVLTYLIHPLDAFPSFF
ncbi:hypothetical protein AXG93_1842s1030 [Marchantia polymorpha subsp. ruderalis]|uniref:Uncharacterized protein n=2 Tax=Marchantia polymorpha TaxID=3197 RepID=A0A176WE80_MARPO|nr:hypothetical protein AXG93_1842s1030 [Marchantia polymorpha subsp. ruderalis]